METINLKVTEKEFKLIMGGLVELPAKLSMDLILKLDKEGKRQFAEAEAKNVETSKSKK